MGFSGEGLSIDGIGHFLSDHFLTVPTNQRSYMWERDNVESFWQDILNAIDEQSEDYFIGSIVVSGSGSDVLEVVDGQQRLATTTIIFGAIRDYFLLKAGEDRARVIEEKYLVSTNEDTLEDEPRLSLNTDDDQFFREHVVFRTPDGRRENPFQSKQKGKRPKDSHKNIASAAEVIRGFVYNYVKDSRPADAISRLMRVVKYVRDHVKLISVVVHNHQEAYTIFETLNDRGLDLSKADLLKNHLFRTADKKLKEVESKWAAMIGALETVSKKDITVDYIRYLWISEHGHVRGKDLYKRIKKEVSEQGNAIEFAHDLADSAVLYAAILNSDHPRWDEFGESAKADLSNLIMLGIDRIHPITLAIVRMFKAGELKKSLYFLVCASVRILIAGPAPGGTFEQRISEVAPRITDGTIKTAKELAGEMVKQIVPGDAEFAAEFATQNVSQTNLARYYFRAMENAGAGDAEPARVTKEESKGNIEHVLPINRSDAWKHIKEDIAKAYYKRIGNLALMRPKDNADIGNKDFLTVKVAAYAKSSLKLTQELAKFKKWDADSIEARQKKLAELAVKTWPIKVR